jgi:hypothetical protein
MLLARTTLRLAFVAFTGLTACGAGVAVDATRSDADGVAPRTSNVARAQAIVNLQQAAGCGTAAPFAIGSWGDPDKKRGPDPVEDGASASGTPVSVACRVSARPGGHYALSATVAGAPGTMVLSATIDAASGASAAQVGTLSLTRQASSLSSALCTLTGLEDGAESVAPGRYQGSLQCTASSASGTCAISGQVRFENCAME